MSRIVGWSLPNYPDASQRPDELTARRVFNGLNRSRDQDLPDVDELFVVH